MLNRVIKKKVIKMDMYQKRKVRKEKRENSSNEKDYTNITINWLITIYPRIEENPDKIRTYKN